MMLGHHFGDAFTELRRQNHFGNPGILTTAKAKAAIKMLPINGRGRGANKVIEEQQITELITGGNILSRSAIPDCSRTEIGL